MDSETAPHQAEPAVELVIGSTSLTLLGTAHVSRASAAEVERRLADGDYDAVAVELCASRYRAIVEPETVAKMDLFQVIKKRQVPMVAASLVLGAFQQRVAEQLGVEPGAEMRAAITGAEDRDLPLYLIDRDVGITLRRAYRSVPWWQRFYLIAALVTSAFSRGAVDESDVEALKHGDLLESAFAEFAQRSGALFRPLIAERDEYLAARLLQELKRDHPARVLAVVGAGHLKGVQRHLDAGIEEIPARLRALTEVPPASRWLDILPWIIVAVILAGFVVGFLRSPELGWRLIAEWVLINGGLSAAGAALAGGHVLTVLSAFVAAPLTSLNPSIGAGMVTGIVELTLRRPTVGDFANVRRETSRLQGWRRNPVARCLLVFVLSSLGSIVGTYLAGARMFGLLS
jgi:pheromone shutdown-related protein TraB